MPHLTVNGVTFPGEANSFAESPEFIGDVTGRSQSGALVESRTTRKRRWSVRSVFLQAAEAEAWRTMLEGGGHQWSLSGNAISSKGVGPQAGGTFSFATMGAPAGNLGCISVGAGASVAWNLASVMGPGWTPTSGYTVAVYRQNSTTLGDTATGFFRYLVTGSVTWTVGTPNPGSLTQYQDGTSGSFAVGRWLEMSSAGVLSLFGEGDAAGANFAHNYAMLTALPFALPSGWQSSLVSFTDTRRLAGLPWISQTPRVVLGGDAIPDANGVSVCARVTVLEQRNVVLGGAHRNNARVLTVDFIEV